MKKNTGNQVKMNKEKALEIYQKYLSTQWARGDGVPRLPLGTKVLKAMTETANKTGYQHRAGPTTLEKAMKGGRRVLFWSDQHFFHNNIIKYANRPDEDYSAMNERLAQNYFDTVRPNDVVVWLGDCSFGPAEGARNYFVGKNFPGYKILIMGNHDLNKKDASYRDMKIFYEVFMCDGFDYEIDGVERPVIFGHYPIEKSLLPEKALNFHGHIHDYNIGLPHVNVSVEVIDYRPQPFEYCLALAQNCRPGSFVPPHGAALSQDIENEALLSDSFIQRPGM